MHGVIKSAGFTVELNIKLEKEYTCDKKSANEIAGHNIACCVVDYVRHLDKCGDNCIIVNVVTKWTNLT
ncbi:MAG: hypothetical protein DRN71_02935 [Candidatus Nanohalarchaeota archaeon]|nr:MAG: hypothetical protein DRN71_02935 [Candidatus Nanohaloarchaeota archaeon]